MPTISLCMIVKDAEKTIGPALDSIRHHVDEVVIVDTGSTDGTKEAVRDCLDPSQDLQILDFTPETHPEAFLLDSEETWQGKLNGPFTGKPFLADFAAARTLGWAAAKGDYRLWIDADDVVEGGGKLRGLVADMDKVGDEAAFLVYDYAKDTYGNVIMRQWRERIIKREAAGRWVNPVHEICLLAPETVIRNSEEMKIIHKRGEYGIITPVKWRNLKILLDWSRRVTDKEKAADPRLLYYLATEMRRIWPEQALAHFRHYVSVSGAPDERAVAHCEAGDLYERSGRYNEALAEYAQAEVAAPHNPDGLFGAARIAYHKIKSGTAQVSWYEVIEKTERGLAVEPRKGPVMAWNPLDRSRSPYIYYSDALFHTGQFEKGIAAAEKGLELSAEGTEAHKWLTENRDKCAAAMGGAPLDGGLRLRFDKNEPLSAPAMPVPDQVLVEMALQLWKRARQEVDLDSARKLLDALPPSIGEHKRIEEARKYKPFVPRERKPAPEGKRDIVIWTGPGLEKWTPESIESGIGGSETAAVYMARHLAARGHQVRVYNDCRDDEGDYDGVEYLRYERALENTHVLDCDLFVSSRMPVVFLEAFEAKAKILWVHDVHCGEGVGPIGEGLMRADAVLCLTKWHREYFCKTYPFLDPNRVFITRNGIDTERYKAEPEKIGNRCIYAHSPDRGLPRLLELWPRIRAEVPDAELHVHYGFDNLKKMGGGEQVEAMIAKYEKLLADSADKGVIDHGRTGQQALAESYLAAKVMAYPTWFSETSCIGAMEAQAAGCIPVTTRLAALEETVKHGSVLEGPETAERYATDFVHNVTTLLRDSPGTVQTREAARKHGLTLDWSGVAEHWDEFIFPRVLELLDDNPLPRYGDDD